MLKAATDGEFLSVLDRIFESSLRAMNLTVGTHKSWVRCTGVVVEAQDPEGETFGGHKPGVHTDCLRSLIALMLIDGFKGWNQTCKFLMIGPFHCIFKNISAAYLTRRVQQMLPWASYVE